MSLACHRLFHAGYQIQSPLALIWMDPILDNNFSVNVESYPQIKFEDSGVHHFPVEAVVISHIHDDHLSLTSLNKLKRNVAIYIYSPLYLKVIYLIKSLGFKEVYAIEPFESFNIKDIEIKVWPALDNEVDCLLSFHSQGFNILNVVDSWIPAGIINRLARTIWDLVLWPFQYLRESEVLSPDRFNQVSHSILPEHLEQLSELTIYNLVMSSCQFRMQGSSWLNHKFFSLSYAQFASQLNDCCPKINIINLLPGQGLFFLPKQVVSWAASLGFISILAEQGSNDYYFDPYIKVPLMSQLASQLGSLDLQEELFLHLYIRHSLPETLTSLEWEKGSLFCEPLFTWQLLIYDHQGRAQSFFMMSDQGKFCLTEAVSNPDWVTEVSAARFYQALTKGFPLTSLYLQIARQPLSSRGESYLKEPYQLFNDPLVKALYTPNPLKYFDYEYAQIRLGCHQSSWFKPKALL